MSSTSLEQLEESLTDASAEEIDADYEIMSQFMDFMDTNVVGNHDSQWYANKLTQLLHSPAVKQKIKILKKLQWETTKIETNFFSEIYALECKYHQLFAPIYEKRKLIVTGAYQPTDQEAQSLTEDEDVNLGNQLKNKAKIEEEKTPEIILKIPVTKDKPDAVGIPNFWLTVFQNDTFLSEMVYPQDEPILTHLQDIKVECSENPMSFTLVFHFSPNQYFTNLVLTKEYFMKCELNENTPLNFDGPEIYKCKGCIINWNKDMNVTLKTVKKNQKHRRRGVVRTVSKTFEYFSFFNFFAPPDVSENAEEEDIDNELCYLLTFDFEIGNYIRQKIVPKAVLFYLGEMVEDEADDDNKKHDLKVTNEESESNQEENNIVTKDDATCEQQ